MSRDWYDAAVEQLFEELSDMSGAEAYSFLSEIGLIDYDVEKEILWERYVGDEEE